ncbi:probable ubiquitin carboxyl-terminal hydrolase MINDY-4 isoform X2 [Girardinichthys multiradiatus]|uniref:probable ubiquitin carboxyl-terminal hydrolase MINDY-4 isoform X2 n=1 Tax=Girardinichthys multiradiatus TaxID=208333 RepID=UPI001FACE1D0|nr:probable ubiquitin carboxyl-terminal hydrolase MINDY-4 isoform X2 [Girardinichthys multiradiatus]
MVPSVEEVSSSLVREYLSRKGLKRTIACMDEEHPRTQASINNRSLLKQFLNIEDLYRKNKVQKSPLKTLLEIIVKHHIERLHHETITTGHSLQIVQTTGSTSDYPAGTLSMMNQTKADEISRAFCASKHTELRSEVRETSAIQVTNLSTISKKDKPASLNPNYFLINNTDYQEGQSLMLSKQENITQSEAERNSLIAGVTQRSKTSRIRRGLMAGPIPQESNRKRHSQRVEVPQPLFIREEESRESQDGLQLAVKNTSSWEEENVGFIGSTEENQNEKSYGRKEQRTLETIKVKTRPNVLELNVSEMELDDIDDGDGLPEVSLQRVVSKFNFAGCPMDRHTVMELKTVLLGSSLSCFSTEWKNQGFTFSDACDLRYGIVQRKGGPCGILASIQAFFLKKLLFENTDSKDTILQRLRPSSSTRRQCLVSALADVLWRAGEEKQATVALNSGRSHFTPVGHCSSERLLEKMTCFSVDNIKDLQVILEQHIEQYETGMLGCLLLTISAVLSRSIEKVREDMDLRTNTLIGAHGYCTQELVNLLLCGRAVSNVFDNDIELDSGNGDRTLLKGIKDQCQVGLLSLFEHYNICKVGAYLKSPYYPVWVVCSESHFSVLFGLQRELLINQDEVMDFDLYYYDGLANQQEEIRLTVSVGKLSQNLQEDDADLVPPLELCIRTRWKDALVSWNETEPIL